MKKALSFLLALVCLSFLCACGNSTADSTEAVSDAAIETAAEETAADEVTEDNTEPDSEMEEPEIIEEEAADITAEEESADTAEEEDASDAAGKDTVPDGYSPDVVFTAENVITGEAISSDIFCEYDITMMNFWEPWCGPCVSEMPDIETLYQDLTAKGLKVLILGVYSTEDGAKDVLDELGISYPVIRYDSVFDSLQSGYVPNTVFFNREGKLVSDESADMGVIYVGSRSYSDWNGIIESLLADS